MFKQQLHYRYIYLNLVSKNKHSELSGKRLDVKATAYLPKQVWGKSKFYTWQIDLPGIVEMTVLVVSTSSTLDIVTELIEAGVLGALVIVELSELVEYWVLDKFPAPVAASLVDEAPTLLDLSLLDDSPYEVADWVLIEAGLLE